MRLIRSLPLLGLAAALASCAPKAPPAPIAVAAPPPPPAPVRDADLPVTLAVPALRPDGRYATINRDLTSAASVWHVRSALNVAALGCRGAEEGAMIAAYNHLLKTHKAALAAADRGVQAEFRTREPKMWQASHDRYNTRIYNFFAQPLAPARFCATALAIATEVEAVPGAGLPLWAASALDRLEAPFTEVYARYEDWQRRYASWSAGQTADAPRLAYASMPELMAWAPEATGPVRTASLR